MKDILSYPINLINEDALLFAKHIEKGMRVFQELQISME